ncbi:MAG: response regulator transcription factor [Lacisediminihabitans sp.]
MVNPSQARPPAIRVGVVDNHRLVLDGIVAHLTSRMPGIDVVLSEASWIGLLSHSEFPVDVVVLDLNLDDNIPVGTKIRALGTAGAKTIVMSRHADPSSIYAAVQAGALAFVPKTEPADELVAAIRSVAAGHQYQNQPLVNALAGTTPDHAPGLGKQEHRALVLYASGRSIKEVAIDMGTTEETIKSYIKRGRRKYRDLGIDLGTKILLRRHGIREGWLSPE